MNFTKVCKSFYHRALLSSRSAICMCPLGMSLVVVYQQSPTSLIDEPQGRRGWGAIPRGSRYAHLGAAGEEGSHLDVYIQNCLATWECLGVHTKLFVYAGALLGPKRNGAFAPPAALEHQQGFPLIWPGNIVSDIK